MARSILLAGILQHWAWTYRRDMNRIRRMKQLLQLPAAKLQQIVVIKRQIERLESRLAALVDSESAFPSLISGRKKRKMSAAARRKISLAAKARWARFRAAKKK